MNQRKKKIKNAGFAGKTKKKEKRRRFSRNMQNKGVSLSGNSPPFK